MNVQDFREYLDSLPVISTHEHHLKFPPDEPATLERLFSRSYVAWGNVDFRVKANRARFLDANCGRSYFVWYEKALNDLFDFGGEITETNWDEISEKTSSALADKHFHERVFSEKCRYSWAIQDSYWDPGSDNSRPDLYAPTFRINSFVFSYSYDSVDHNSNNAQHLYGKCEDFDEYLGMIDRVIGEMKAKGCVALKSALAYDRPLDFREHNKADAAKVFGKSKADVSAGEEKVFGDFIFDYICELAAKYSLPFQNHTGLAKLSGSNPMNLIPMIEKHPETRFVLFHGGFPWTEETAALAHNYPNVVIDLCWLPAISTSAAERLLRTFLETAMDCSRITWGGDCWFVTESYGHLLAAKYVIAKVLSGKVNSGYLSRHRAERIAQRILSENAIEIYGSR